MWGRLLTCGPIAHRPAWRLPTATQLGKPPHNPAWLFADDRVAVGRWWWNYDRINPEA